MAVTSIWSSSPTHSTLPSLKTLHPLPPPSLSSSPSSCSNKYNININLVTNEALALHPVIESATDAAALASAAVRTAKDAVSFANGAEEVCFDDGECESVLKMMRRRSRRKKRTKESDFLDKENGELDYNLVKYKILCKERESQERIIRSYRSLVVSIATGYQGKGLSLKDLIQEGSIGLLRGAKRFNPERGYKLSTYVYWWIKQAIIRAIANKSRTIRLPGSMAGMVAKIAEANNVLSRRLRRMPTDSEIAEMLNIHVSTVRLAIERTRHPISLDGAVTDRGCMTMQDIIPGPDETMPERMVQKQLMKQELKELLQTLSEREADILRLHFGLDGQTPVSCKEIGRLLSLSRERIRQIRGIALTKLQQTNILNNLKVYMV
ncbi:hypothetical protein CISIN_1g046578mg [Citrus sinensis]|uniref:RNA polymerase sigma-70 domain-containing protein n=1 Tax=Citrus sinensis TaxID=2711 RepID=A0A067H6K6_CITSI|nr:hypothetical protein CISIN_1g046578mg [Citrus sinensis]